MISSFIDLEILLFFILCRPHVTQEIPCNIDNLLSEFPLFITRNHCSKRWNCIKLAALPYLWMSLLEIIYLYYNKPKNCFLFFVFEAIFTAVGTYIWTNPRDNWIIHDIVSVKLLRKFTKAVLRSLSTELYGDLCLQSKFDKGNIRLHPSGNQVYSIWRKDS